MRTKIITALYDIDRETKGDGRTLRDYLEWFKTTLKLKCDMSIYIEEKFYDFVKRHRDPELKTDIIIQNFNEIPYYPKLDKIKNILDSKEYKSRMRDPLRIECYLPEYNVIQYSKFDWVCFEIDKDPSYDIYMWMDAGFSRFFDNFDITQPWPNPNKLPIDKFTVQGNINFINRIDTLNVNEYIWDNNCLLSGGLFGGGKEIMKFMKDEIDKFVDFLFENQCFNNEQFGLASISKNNREKFNVILNLYGTPMPIFKILS